MSLCESVWRLPKRLVPEELPCIEPALPPPKGMLNMLMFNVHQFHHTAAVGSSNVARSLWSTSWQILASRQFWGSRLFESSRRSTQDKVKRVKTK